MATLPTVGGSENEWELNTYLLVAHAANGKIKTGALMASSTAPTANAGVANKKYVDDIVQRVNVMSGAVDTGTTTMPFDDTIPQITEGDEYMTLAITPKKATNKLKIEVVCHLAQSNDSDTVLMAALFQDTTADALAAGFDGRESVANKASCVTFTHYMTAGTTSEITFRVRGGSHSAGTITFNGQSGSRIFGGVMASSITITEIRV